MGEIQQDPGAEESASLEATEDIYLDVTLCRQQHFCWSLYREGPHMGFKHLASLKMNVKCTWFW